MKKAGSPRIHNHNAIIGHVKLHIETFCPKVTFLTQKVPCPYHMGKASLWSEVDDTALRALPPLENSGWEMLSIQEVFTILYDTVDVPSVDNFICLLQKCREKNRPSYAKRVHQHICASGLETHRFVGNYIVPMFVECGSVLDAVQVFKKLVHRTVHSWTSLISEYVHCGEFQHAFNLCKKMQENSVASSSYTLVALLKACTKLNDVGKGRHIHAEIVAKGFEKDLIVGSTLVDMYAKCGSPSEAQRVFEKLPIRDVVSWSALMAGHTEHGHVEEALKFFQQMQLEGINPDATIFICILKACDTIEQGFEIHLEITKRAFESDLFVGNALINFYAKSGSLVDAQETFDKLSARDIVSWTALIAGYAEFEICEEALNMFENMEMEGISSNAVTYTSILKACSSTETASKGQQLHTEVIQKGLERDVFVGGGFVDMYAKCSLLSDAVEVFDRLPIRDTSTWNAVIAGYAEHGFSEEVLKWCQKMQVEGVPRDAITFTCALKACGNIRAIEKGYEMHVEILQMGLESEVSVCSTLVDIYARCGSLLEARETFSKLPAPSIVSWNALITGYAEHGPMQETLECFERMQSQGLSPSDATFVCVLKSCGSLNALCKGQEVHTDVVFKGLEILPFVSSTLVDMYGKCGALAEAQEVFDKLPARNVVTCTALITGLAEHGLGQKALDCFEQILMEGVSPNAALLTSVLKASGCVGSLERGRGIHREITQRGFESDLLVGNAIIDMYAKYGSVAEAQKTFETLPAQDVVSWNAMIKGHGINHEGDKALQSFEAMQEQGVKPNANTFTCLINACCHSNLVPKGQDFFKMMKEDHGIAPKTDHFYSMIDLLARSGHLHEAEKFLTSVPCSPSQELWIALLDACKTHEEVELGLKCFSRLVRMNPECAAPYVLMENIYANAGVSEMKHISRVNIQGLWKSLFERSQHELTARNIDSRHTDSRDCMHC